MSPALLASSASLWAGAAWAEDAAEVVGEAPKDPVVEALFFVVVALLTVVTAGVRALRTCHAALPCAPVRRLLWVLTVVVRACACVCAQRVYCRSPTCP